jgi:hypothetical protein
MRESNATAEELPPAGFFFVLTFYACLCIIVGLLGNVGVIVYNTFIMNETKTPTTYFLVNLAISDIIVCLTFFPPWLYEFILILTETENELTPICKIRMTSSYTSTALSIANLFAITIDRCLFITKPLKYPRIMTWKRTYILLAGIWLLTIVNANLVFFNIGDVTGQAIRCTIKDRAIGKLAAFFSFYLPVAGVLFLNYKIYKAAKIQRRKIRECCSALETKASNAGRRGHLQQIKLIKTFTIVLGVLLFCVLPRLITSTIALNFCQGFCIPISVSISVTMIMGTNSVMNPLIYSLRNKEYRTVYLKFITGLFRKN